MVLPITDEMRAAIQAQPGLPLQFADEQTQQSFILVDLEEYRRLLADRLREDLQVAFDQAERGEIAPWNVDEFLRKAHRSTP